MRQRAGLALAMTLENDHAKGIKHLSPQCAFCSASPTTNTLGLSPLRLTVQPSPSNPLVSSPLSYALNPQQRETVTIIRVLADMEGVALIGSVTNLWLDGPPQDSTIVGYYEDAPKTGRDLNVVCRADAFSSVTKLIESIVVRKLTLVRQNGIEIRVNTQLMIRFTIAASAWDALVTTRADITANMKYVQQNELQEILPASIEDAKEGRLMWLDTCSNGRRYDIENKRNKAKKALQLGFYGVCAEPPPPPIEQYQGVIRGWRVYRWAQANSQVNMPVLQGDTGRVWTRSTFEGTCRHSTKEAISDPDHMKGCSCGIYMHTLPRVNWNSWDVYAECVAWGNVVVHTNGKQGALREEWGYRAQFVRIERLFCVSSDVEDDWMRVLKAVYAVGVERPLFPLYNETMYAQYLGVPKMFNDRHIG